jgi:aspartyl-tRNA(Asn)/glutamyl-tRNA(Gln) amidotransferase subunit B
MNKAGVDREDIATIKIAPQQLADLTKLVDSGKLNKGTATTVLEAMWATGDDPVKIVEAKGLAQVSDEGVIADAIAKVLAENVDTVQGYLSGKDKLFGALMGKAMGELKGKGNPQTVKEILTKQIEALKE